MHHAWPVSVVASAPPVLSLDADPAHLDALAGYFEAQARALRATADEIRSRARRNALAAERRKVAGWRFLLLGGRASRAYESLKCWRAVADRLELSSAERAQYAAAQYRKRRKAREAARRSLEILRADAAGAPHKEIGARFNVTARRVRQIIAETERRLSRSPPPSRRCGP